MKLELRKLRAGEVASLNGCVVVGRLVDRPVVGQGRHLAPRPLEAVVGVGGRRPVGAQVELAVGMGEAVEEMRLLERRRQSSQRAASSSASVPRPEARSVQSMISRGVMAKPGWRAPSRSASATTTSWLERQPSRRLDRLGAELQILVAAAGVEVVVLEEHRRRQHDVGVARGVGEELLVDADEQVVAREAAAAPSPGRGRRRADWCSGSASP